MEDVRKADPKFTNFVPRTATEAVDRYVRCRRNGLKPMLVPECLIECAKGLDEKQLDLLESWCICPDRSLENVKLVPADTIRLANEAIYMENCKRFGEPPLPLAPSEQDDEKLTEQPGSTSTSSLHSTPST